MSIQKATTSETARVWVGVVPDEQPPYRAYIGTTISHTSSPFGYEGAQYTAEELVVAADMADRFEAEAAAVPGNIDHAGVQAIIRQVYQRPDAALIREKWSRHRPDDRPFDLLPVLEMDDQRGAVAVLNRHQHAVLSPADARELAAELRGLPRSVG